MFKFKRAYAIIIIVFSFSSQAKDNPDYIFNEYFDARLMDMHHTKNFITLNPPSLDQRLEIAPRYEYRYQHPYPPYTNQYYYEYSYTQKYPYPRYYYNYSNPRYPYPSYYEYFYDARTGSANSRYKSKRYYFNSPKNHGYSFREGLEFKYYNQNR